MSAAGEGSSWALLEPYVLRRDDEDCFPDESKSFPDETEAPIRASGVTSWGAPFRVAFSVAEPPRVSHLYARLPVPLLPPACRWRTTPVGILATHRHLALLPFSTNTPSGGGLVQDLFIFRANNPCNNSSLILLPPRLRVLLRSLGLWCGDQDEFVVAELQLYIPSSCTNKAFADICMLRGDMSSSSPDKVAAGCRWKSVRVEIILQPTHNNNNNNPADDADHDLWQLCRWGTDTAVGFQRWLCWIDYHTGILFCDMSNQQLPAPTISFLRFPLITNSTCNIWYSGVSVVDCGRALKFVNVCHHDTLDHPGGRTKPDTAFTITCHTLVVLGDGGMAWQEDYTVCTSDDLCCDDDDANNNLPDSLRCGTLKFPRVDADRPHVVHFLSIGFGCANNNMWVVSIDMSAKAVESSHLYINGREHLPTNDTEFIIKKISSPLPFVPCEFPRFYYSSRGEDSVISDSNNTKKPMTIKFGEFNIHVKHGKKAEDISQAVSSSVLPCNLIFKGINLLKKEEKKAKKYINIGSMPVEIA